MQYEPYRKKQEGYVVQYDVINKEDIIDEMINSGFTLISDIGDVLTFEADAYGTIHLNPSDYVVSYIDSGPAAGVYDQAQFQQLFEVGLYGD